MSSYQLVIYILLIALYLIFMDIAYKSCKHLYQQSSTVKSFGFIAMFLFGASSFIATGYMLHKIYNGQATGVAVERIVNSSPTMKLAASNIAVNRINCQTNPNEPNCKVIKSTVQNLPDNFKKKDAAESILSSVTD